MIAQRARRYLVTVEQQQQGRWILAGDIADGAKRVKGSRVRVWIDAAYPFGQSPCDGSKGPAEPWGGEESRSKKQCVRHPEQRIE